jgi:hypothetical protein
VLVACTIFNAFRQLLIGEVARACTIPSSVD